MKQTNITYLGSGLADCGCGCGGDCGGGGLDDAISSDYATVKIIGRKPESGSPPEGLPFSIDVEVHTFKTGGPTWLRTPFACLDAFVVVRGDEKYNNEILGHSFVRTSWFQDCVGSTTITLDRRYRPGPDDYVRLELYPGGTVEWTDSRTTIEEVEAGEVKPIAISEPIRFNASQKELEESGVIQSSQSFGLLNPIGEAISNNAGVITGLLAAAAGSYLVFTNAGNIRTYVNQKLNQ